MISKLLPFRIKYDILLCLQRFKALSYFKNINIDIAKNQVYIFLAADYGNLGDVAITYAQTKFLQKNSDYQVIEIPISQSLEGLWFVKKHIKTGDLVSTVGGGNMGDIYGQIEYIRQLTIRFFPDNKIISFPQTFDFSETARGQKALKLAKKTYNNHKNLHIVAREQTSFNLMRKNFSKAQVLLTPDIVLSLDKTEPAKPRKGVLICMRKDAEKSLTDAQSDFIIQTIKNHYSDVRFYDTHIHKNKLSVKDREEALQEIWNAFKSSELVVTDRLHGMIFCHITGTPTLVFQNNNHKVRETFEWIKENKKITLCKDFDEVELLKYFKIKQNINEPKLSILIAEYQNLIKILNN
jgi:pyruvyl transferase EpsI